MLLSVFLGAFLASCCLLPVAESRQLVIPRDIDLVQAVNLRLSDSLEDNDDDLAEVSENMFMFMNDSRSKFGNTLSSLSRYLPINVDYARTVGGQCDIIKNNKQFYTIIPLIVSAVLIVLGIIFGFFGYRLIKVVLYLIGFLISFAVVYFGIIAFTQERSENWIPYVALGSAIVVGLIVGLITICIYYVGIFFVGGSTGFLIAWCILGFIDIGYFQDHIYVPIIIALVLAILVGIIALTVQKWFFMIGSSVLGGFIMVWGLDYYLELGFMIYYLLLFAEKRSELKPCWYSWLIIPVFIILIVTGFLVQALLTGRKYNHKKEMRGVCCGLCKKRKKKDETEMKQIKTAPHGGPKYQRLPGSEKLK